MVVRVTFEKLVNPFLTARLFLKFVGCSRAIVIPQDSQGRSVVIVDAVEEASLGKRIKAIPAPLQYEVLASSFDEVAKQLENVVNAKKAFVIKLHV